MIEQYIPIILSLISAGIFAGLLAGLFGVGGGMVIVPVLFFLFQNMGVSPESAMIIATATSLASIVPTSLSSIRSHHQKGNVDFLLFRRWLPAICAGVFLGSWLVTQVPGTWFTILFGTIAVLSSLNMLFRASKSALTDSLPSSLWQNLIASGIGFFSAMIGIGGGTLSVPVLTACNYPTHKAVGTSAAIGLAISLPGAVTMLIMGSAPSDAPIGTVGLVNFLGLACIVPLTVLCAPIGAALAAKLDSNILKKSFAVLLFVTGLRMLAQLVL